MQPRIQEKQAVGGPEDSTSLGEFVI